MRLCGDLDLCVTIKCRYLDFAAERSLGKADRHFTVKVITVSGKDFVGADMNHHVQIAGRPAIDAGFTFSGQAYAVAFVNAGWNFYRECFLLLDSPVAATGRARIVYYLAAAMTFRARLLY